MQPIQVTSVSSKGQVVIPNNIRHLLGISMGAKLLVFTDGDNLLLKPIQEPQLKTFTSLIEASRKIIASKKTTPADLKKMIKKVRNENRS